MNITMHITHPIHIDYPVWRKQFERYHPFVFQTYMSLHDSHAGYDIKNYIKQAYSRLGVAMYEPIERGGQEDWRSKSINHAYNNFNGEWIWFTEQDFFIHDESFFKVIEENMDYHDFIVLEEHQRLHPACLFVKKSLADKTSRDFSPVVDKYDHFYTFTEELKKNTSKWTTLQQQGLLPNRDFFHMTGLTHNYHRVRLNLEPTRSDEFVIYNMICLRLVEKDYPFYNDLLAALQWQKPGKDYTKEPFYQFLSDICLSSAQ